MITNSDLIVATQISVHTKLLGSDTLTDLLQHLKNILSYVSTPF